MNSDETSLFAPAIPTEAAFDTALLAYTAGNQMLADSIKAQYPVADYQGLWRRAFVALTSDAKFVCTARLSARAADQG
ncbi:MAG TPA: hypothetical protein VFB62_13865, partial [Polyangiaceae bacterium]|nr:hypothetical protein [Polyangiaceae bacterium]